MAIRGEIDAQAERVDLHGIVASFGIRTPTDLPDPFAGRLQGAA
jgi:hypothetical protein